jgi:sugar phosphate isomerase/epimerase
MFISALLSSLPLPFEDAVRAVAGMGFTHVDVVALAERPAVHLEALAETGLLVSCGGIGKGLPDDWTLDTPSLDLRHLALAHIKSQIADAARLGATHVYLTAGLDGSPDGLLRFGESCALLADYAAGRMVRLCVEPIPGRALPSAASVLEMLNRLNHDHLALLIDVGHCLISREDPADVVRLAGKRLGYVHLDDNDGVGDLHWPLLTGKLTEQTLTAFLKELKPHGYDGALTLELNPQNPPTALADGKRLLERLLG